MRAEAGLLPGFPTMRSCRFIRPHLLRVFAPTHKVSTSAAGGHGLAAVSAVALACHQALTQLEAAVQYERKNGLKNVQGEYRTFAETLADNLRELSRSEGLSDAQKQALPALLERSQQYPALSGPQRQELLQQVESAMGLQPAIAYPRSQNSRLQDGLAAVLQLQDAYRQRQQRQQLQQQRPPAAGGPPPGPPAAASPQQRPVTTVGPGSSVNQQQKPWQHQQKPWQHQQQQAWQQALAQQGTRASAVPAWQASQVAAATSPPKFTSPQRIQAAPGPTPAVVAAAQPAALVAVAASKGQAVGEAAGARQQLPEGWVEPSEYLPPASWTQVVPILYDLETTGRSVAKDWIVEMAARQLSSGEEFESLLRLEPWEEMGAGAADANSLTTEWMRDARHPRRRDVLHKFYGWVEQQLAVAAPGAVVLLIGHKITTFDCKFLNRHLQWAGLPPLPHARLLDTLQLARGMLPALASHSLENLARHFGELEEGKLQSHRALDDVRLNERVLRHLLREMKEEGTSWEMFLAKDQHALHYSPGATAWLGQVDWRVSRSLKVARPRPSVAAAVQRSPADAKLLRGFQAAAEAPLAAQAAPAPAAGLAAAGEAVVEAVQGADAGAGRDVMEGFIWEEEEASIPSMDPLVQLEEGSQGPGLPSPTFGDLVACRSAWQRLLAQEGEGEDASSRHRSFLDSPLKDFAKGENKFTKKALQALGAGGITTLKDLLEYYPKDYRSAMPGQLPTEGEGLVCLAVKLVGHVKAFVANVPRVMATLQVIPPEELGLPAPPAAAATAPASGAQPTLKVVKFSYSHWAVNTTRAALQKLDGGGVVYGRVRQTGWEGPGEWEVVNGEVEVVDMEEARELFGGGDAKVEPLYSASGELTGKHMVKHVATALAILEASPGRWQDPLPSTMLEEEGLLGFLEALKGLHQPKSLEQLEECRRRLAFQELLALQLRLLLQRHLFRLPDREEQMRGVHISDYTLVERAIASLPYQLTGGQQRALEQLKLEMGQWPPMMCLLQGDVGCGKTIVAFLSLLAAAGSGYQGCIMAPTEILAEQHFANLQRLLGQMAEAGGEAGGRIPTAALLTGSVLGKERSRIYAGLADGSIDIAVGTHALLTKAVRCAKLGLAVVDEQHRFGVAQRSKLRDKSCPSPHVLYMTATPIPRTSALVLHGDMSQVVIDEMPPGRTKVATHAVLDSEPARHEVYQHMQREIADGGQAYIICPLVEESDKEGLAEIKAATQEQARLVAEGILREGQCGLLHGQLKSTEKEAALRAFASGATPVLISTTVVEVGVDVPAASIMLVEHADRFGLAQLHQLRGRVGRGARASTCYLFADKPDNMGRLRVMEQHHSGFRVAEADLWIRGPGEVLGTSQSGKENLSALKVCKLPQDRDLVPRARQAAARYLSAQSVAADPSSWQPELLSLVCGRGLPQLDLRDIKAAE